MAAGVLGGPFTTFLPALGSFLYILAFTLVGVFALPPLLLLLLVVYPLAEVREGGGETRQNEVLVAVEVLRWLAFGAALNTLTESALPGATGEWGGKHTAKTAD